MAMEHRTLRPRRPLRVGDLVWIRRGLRRVEAKVIEDRGGIGVGGRQLVRIDVRVDADYRTELEVPVEILERRLARTTRRRKAR